MRWAATVFAAILVAAVIAVPNIWHTSETPMAGDICTPTGCLAVIPPAERMYGEPTLAPAPRVAVLSPRTEVIAVTVEVESQ